MELEMMRVAAPHIGVEPCAGAKTDVMGFPRVVVECLLALAQRTRGRAAIEIVDLYEVAKAVASEPPRALHADGPADAGLEGLLGLRQALLVLVHLSFRVWPIQTSKRAGSDFAYASIIVLSSTDLLTL